MIKIDPKQTPTPDPKTRGGISGRARTYHGARPHSLAHQNRGINTMLRWLDAHNCCTNPTPYNKAVFAALVVLAGIVVLTAAYIMVETITWMIT